MGKKTKRCVATMPSLHLQILNRSWLGLQHLELKADIEARGDVIRISLRIQVWISDITVSRGIQV